ncbi:MAG: hypothetical protein KGL35_13955 [Bradyrhizobium sp.]|nr:hypothetical protein [Bradyrhizobium sp.]
MAGFATASDQFFWPDWLSDQGLRMSSRAARGLWMDMLALMANSDEKGFLLKYPKVGRSGEPMPLDQLHYLTRDQTGTIENTRALLDELARNGVYSIDRRNVIYCRRMVREDGRRRASSKGGKAGGPTSLERGVGIHASEPVDNSRDTKPTRYLREVDEQAPSLTPATASEIRSTRGPTRCPTHIPSRERDNISSSRTVTARDKTTVTIADQDERIRRFGIWLNTVCKVPWPTIAAAMDCTNPEHRHKLEVCRKAARDNGKGWPHKWPTDINGRK